MQNDVNTSYIHLPIHLVFTGYIIITTEYKNWLHKIYVMPTIREPQQLHTYIYIHTCTLHKLENDLTV